MYLNQESRIISYKKGLKRNKYLHLHLHLRCQRSTWQMSVLRQQRMHV